MTVEDKPTLSHTYKTGIYFQPNTFLNGIHRLQLTNSQGQMKIPVIIIRVTVRVNYDIFRPVNSRLQVTGCHNTEYITN
jgi:uncharacterized protein YpmS